MPDKRKFNRYENKSYTSATTKRHDEYYDPTKLYMDPKMDETTGLSEDNDRRLRLKITQKDLLFINSYLITGNLVDAAMQAGYKGEQAAYYGGRYILGKPGVKEYLARERLKASQKVSWEFEDKLKKLKKIAVTAVPENAKSIEEMAPSVAIQAIAEANKMQGHYSAEKIQQVNVNVDTDLQQVDELLRKYEREY